MSANPLRPDLTGFRRRLAELEGLLADPATFADNRRAAALGAEVRHHVREQVGLAAALDGEAAVRDRCDSADARGAHTR